MKCLIFHCTKFVYRLDHATPVAESGEFPDSGSYENCLVAFIAIEKHDDDNSVRAATGELCDLCKNLKLNSLHLNPFAHLSSDLAKPKQALSLLHSLRDGLRTSIASVSYSPFGWYKSFDMAIMAHNSSQLFRAF